MDAQPCQPYSEAASQLVLSAWLHRIVNGGGEIEARPAGVAAIDRVCDVFLAIDANHAEVDWGTEEPYARIAAYELA